MDRSDMWDRVRDRTEPWDFVVVGGGATGVGVAVDAASRGYDVLLLEAAKDLGIPVGPGRGSAAGSRP